MKAKDELKPKLHKLYMFTGSGTLDLSGIWQTVGIVNVGEENEKWEVTRKFTTRNNSPLDKTEILPTVILKNYAKEVFLNTRPAPADELLRKAGNLLSQGKYGLHNCEPVRKLCIEIESRLQEK
jgi:hypothetical protein